MRQLLKKDTEWDWTEERESDFKKVKETLAWTTVSRTLLTETRKYNNNGC